MKGVMMSKLDSQLSRFMRMCRFPCLMDLYVILYGIFYNYKERYRGGKHPHPDNVAIRADKLNRRLIMVTQNPKH